MHALKGRNGFQITAHWRSQFDVRMRQIIGKCSDALGEFDLILPTPSSSGFCGDFARAVSDLTGVPVLASDFLRKKTVGELLDECHANPPRMRPGQKNALT